MKKEIYIGLIGVALVVMLAGYYLIRYHNEPETISANNTTPVSNTAVISNTGGIVLDKNEVSKHSTRSNCWIIVDNIVYNVTNYLVSHPGGAGEIIPFCGQDATRGFDTKGGRGSGHSSSADQDLRGLLIGQLGSTASTQQINNTNTINGDREGEDD